MVTLLSARHRWFTDGQVVSGVGGQYNFVAMAHSLPDAHSILALRSTAKGGVATSNILWNYGHTTIAPFASRTTASRTCVGVRIRRWLPPC